MLTKKKCGFISLMGFPNAGKSTLINRLVKKKVSIISPKIQTTRDDIKGILNQKNTQFVFVDTPGLVTKKKFQKKNMLRSILKNVDEIDCNLFVVDSTRKISKNEMFFFQEYSNDLQFNFLVLNKIDLIDKHELLDLSQKYNKVLNFRGTFMVSAKKDRGISFMLKKIEDFLPYKDWVYNSDVYTDKNLEFQISEITREKIFILINKELPYSINVKTIFDRKSKNNMRIIQTIETNKMSHKPIIIGKEGKKIKDIGTRARIDIEKLLNRKIFLELNVIVKKK